MTILHIFHICILYVITYKIHIKYIRVMLRLIVYVRRRVHSYSVSVTFTCRASPNFNSDELPFDDDIVAYNTGGYNREAHMRTGVGREARAAKTDR